MDTTYVNIMLVVFLVLAALAIDVGYMYVSDEDLQHTAELSALAGAQAIKQGIHARIQSDPGKLQAVTEDTVQASARVAAIETAIGDHKAVALVEVPNNNTNNMTTENNVTVGFWDPAKQVYTSGGKPVNAIQVRTKRTAESESVGLGEMGAIIAKITGMETANFTPVAIAAIPAQVRANFAVSPEICDSGCRYPQICGIPERKLTRNAPDPTAKPHPGSRYAFTSMSYPVSEGSTLSDMICGEMPPQELCGKKAYIALAPGDEPLRDIESMMYNPKVDSSNKEYDKATGKLLGWWVIAPVVAALPESRGSGFAEVPVTRYALVRISRICASGPTGCSQKGVTFDAPAVCGQDNGLYIDRISCVGCGTKELLAMPGLHPVLVK
ncbi:hypothetical protein OR1_03987 [Geobacter sp. OR-1]|uniref:pilus assembly protein TadG-related protein n=1 Tax=Geobacter sp. OR-1 TaxID=1266765 RepID=UPI000543BB7E|nr:Tad domain-containing protein [Geobacter sp. OR-1]GAM11671.1 hypothetical protein OR1_03987 [Geobacter sp. OR-1]